MTRPVASTLGTMPLEIIREFCIHSDPQTAVSFSQTNKEIHKLVEQCWESVLPHFITQHYQYAIHPEIPLREQFERLYIAGSSNAHMIGEMTLLDNKKYTGVCPTRDGKKAFCSWKKGLVLWDLTTGACLLRIGRNETQAGLVISDDGKRGISFGFGAGRVLTIWDLERGEVLRRLPLWETRNFFSPENLQISSDGKKALFSGPLLYLDGMIKYWNLDTGEEIWSIRIKDGCKRVEMDHDGERILVYCNNGDVQIWDPTLNQCIYAHGRKNPCAYLYFNLYTKKVLARLENNTLLFLDLLSGMTLKTIMLPKGVGEWNETAGTSAFDMNDDGTSAIFICSGILEHWDLTRGKCLHKLINNAISATITHKGRGAFSLTQDRDFHVWDLQSGKCLQVIKEGALSTLCPDMYGMTAVSCLRKGIKVWNIAPLPEERLKAVSRAFRKGLGGEETAFQELPQFVRNAIPRPSKISRRIRELFWGDDLYGMEVAENINLYIGRNILPSLSKTFLLNCENRALKQLPSSIHPLIYAYLDSVSAHALSIIHTKAEGSLSSKRLTKRAVERFTHLPRKIKNEIYKTTANQKSITSRPLEKYGQLAFDNVGEYTTTFEEKSRSIMDVCKILQNSPS